MNKGTKQKVIEIAKETIMNHRNKYVTQKERWLHLVERYDGKLRADSISADTESRAQLGAPYALVENAIPRILSQQPRYKYVARERKDVDLAELYTEFSDYQWEESEAQETLKEIVRWGLVTGLAGWKMGWKEERRITKKRGKEILGYKVTDPTAIAFADKMGVGKNVKFDEEEYTSNYTLTAIRPFDLVWNVDAEDMDDAKVIGNRVRKTVKELKNEGYDTKDLVYYFRNANGEYWKRRIERENISVYQIKKEIEENVVDAYELYVDYLNNGVKESYVVTLATKGNNEISAENLDLVVIGFQENQFDEKFKPIGIYRPVKRLNKFEGMGIIEPALGVLNAEEDTLNMSLEQLWLDIAKPMEYNPANLWKPEEIEYRANTLVPVKQLGASVAPFPTSQPRISDILAMNGELSKHKQNVSGITDFQTGVEQYKGAKTLGEVQIKTQESNARVNMLLDAFEKEVLKPIGKMALQMNKQFLADRKDLMFRIVGKKGRYDEKKIKFKDIEEIKDITPVAGSSGLIEQQGNLQKWTLFLQQASQEYGLPPGVGVDIDRREVYRRILEEGMLVKDPDTIVPSLKEVEEETLKKDVKQIELAKKENANPTIARVTPDQNHEVHMRLHQTEIQKRQEELQSGGGMGSPEEMQMLVQNVNDHTRLMGGQPPAFAQGEEATPPGMAGAEEIQVQPAQLMQ